MTLARALIFLTSASNALRRFTVMIFTTMYPPFTGMRMYFTVSLPSLRRDTVMGSKSGMVSTMTAAASLSSSPSKDTGMSNVPPLRDTRNLSNAKRFVAIEKRMTTGRHPFSRVGPRQDTRYDD